MIPALLKNKLIEMSAILITSSREGVIIENIDYSKIVDIQGTNSCGHDLYIEQEEIREITDPNNF